MNLEADDARLLQRYAAENCEDAFAELVRRHLGLVYGCALRRVNGDTHLAQDVAQQTFAALAREAALLSQRAALGGWLFTTARFIAAQMVRTESRRRTREQEAHAMNELTADSAPTPDWNRLRNVLDETIDQLDERDREAVVLRFIESRSFIEVGARLRLTENGARMRVERALDRMHALLSRRGVSSTTSALALALTSHANVTVPPGLAAVVTSSALAGAGAGVSGSVVATVGSHGFFSMTTLQLAGSGAAAVAVMMGWIGQAKTTAHVREEIAQLRADNAALVQVEAEHRRLMRVAAEVEQLRHDDAEFDRLQQEAGTLRTHLEQLTRAQEQRARQSQLVALDRTPTPQFRLRPNYPAAMRQAGVSGEVLVDFVVDEHGQVKNVQALRSSRGEFEAAAIQAVSSWSFKPGQKGSRAVNTHMQVPIAFVIDGAPPSDSLLASTPTGDETGHAANVVRLETFTVMTQRE